MKRFLTLAAALLLLSWLSWWALMSAGNITSAQVKITGGKLVGGKMKGAAAASSGRSIIFDGTNDYLTSTDTGTAVSSSQVGWRAAFWVRGITSPASDEWMFHEPSGETLMLKHMPGGTYGVIQAVAIGPAFFAPSPSFVSAPAADIIILVTCDTTNGDIFLDVWDSACANHVSTENLSASTSGTNFQSRSIGLGGTTAGALFFTGKMDQVSFLTGAGSRTCPVLGSTTGDIFDWTFDADDGTDAAGHANLTLSGSPAFEDTP
jgi:hypothetical protein